MTATPTTVRARTDVALDRLRARLPYQHELGGRRLAIAAAVGGLALEWILVWISIAGHSHLAEVLHRRSSLVELGLFLAAISLWALGVSTRTPHQQMFDGQEDQTIQDLRAFAVRLAPLPLAGMVLMLPFIVGPSIWLTLLIGAAVAVSVLYVAAYLLAPRDAQASPAHSHDEPVSLDDHPLLGSLPKPARHDSAPATTIEEALAELDGMVGLHAVKEQVHDLVDDLAMQRRRAALGLATPDTTLHLAFVGNPGTGKTTVARLLGKILRALEILESGHVIEAARSNLLGPYVGAPSILTNQRVDEALDGVLFIDEAYTLTPDQRGFSTDNSGQEAVDTLLKRMEDDRGRLVVVAAGYDEPMQRFLESNPGLRDRFTRIIRFDDYSVDQLLEIIHLLAAEQSYRLVGADEVLRAIFERQRKQPNFSNARFARNLLQEARLAHASRWRNDEPSDTDLAELTAVDFTAAAKRIAS